MDVTDAQDRKEFCEALKKYRPNIRMLFQSAGKGLHGDFDKMKIEDDTANPTFITTEWGCGYKWGA